MTRASVRKGWRAATRPKWRPATPQFRPSVEALEGRALMAGGFATFEGPYQFATAVATGTDGNLYVASAGFDSGSTPSGGSITKVAPDGTPLANYPLPPGMEGFSIAAATDGGIWVQGDTQIVRLAPDGTTAEYSVRSGYMVGSTSLAAGPDGSAWFVNNGVSDPQYASAVGASGDITPASIGRIGPDGTITDYPVTDGTPSLVTAGADGSADFVITKADGSVAIGQVKVDGTQGELPLSGNFGNMLSLTLGPDGNLWFLNDNAWTMAGLDSNPPPAPVIGRLTPSGDLTTYTFTANIPPHSNNGFTPPGGLISAPDGNLDFLDNGAIGRVTTAGVITESPVPDDGHGQGDAIGPDGNLWMAYGENGDFQVGLARYTLGDGGGTDPGPAQAPPPPVSGPPAPTPAPAPIPTPITIPAPVPVNLPVNVIAPTPAPPTAPTTDAAPAPVASLTTPNVQAPPPSPTPAPATGSGLFIPLEIAGFVPAGNLDATASDAPAVGHKLGRPSGLTRVADSSSTGN